MTLLRVFVSAPEEVAEQRTVLAGRDRVAQPHRGPGTRRAAGTGPLDRERRAADRPPAATAGRRPGARVRHLRGHPRHAVRPARRRPRQRHGAGIPGCAAGRATSRPALDPVLLRCPTQTQRRSRSGRAVRPGLQIPPLAGTHRWWPPTAACAAATTASTIRSSSTCGPWSSVWRPSAPRRAGRTPWRIPSSTCRISATRPSTSTSAACTWARVRRTACRSRNCTSR